MQAEQVIDKILSDAGAEADKIHKQAQKREAAEQAKLDEEMTRFDKETQEMATQAGETEKSQRLAVARMAAAKEYLAGKAAILEEVFAQARDKLRELPDDEYRDLMSRLMRAAAESGDEQVIADKNDPRVDQKLIDEVNRKLKEGRKGELTLSEKKRDFGGGFLLQRGKIRTNVSINVLVEQAREDLEIELAKDLFGKGADAGRS